MSELRAWRDAHQISQVVLAEKLGIKQPHLCAIETETAAPSLELAVKIFKETGIFIGPLAKATPRQARAIAELVEANAA